MIFITSGSKCDGARVCFHFVCFLCIDGVDMYVFIVYLSYNFDIHFHFFMYLLTAEFCYLLFSFLSHLLPYLGQMVGEEERGN